MKKNTRLIITKILQAVAESGTTLDQAFIKHLPNNHEEASFIKNCAYGSCRWYFQLEAIVDLLLSKPLKTKDHDIYYLIIIGIYQLLHSNTAEHAAVSETVNTTKALKKIWARGLVNACLRKFLREKDSLLEQINNNNNQARYAHPDWLINKLKSHWSKNNSWEDILNANNTQGPMSLRDNTENNSPPVFRQLDQAVDVMSIPGFVNGKISVQDQASQQAAPLLGIQKNMNVLDACSAPGGKTGHLLELESEINLTALDISEERLLKTKENLERLKFNLNNNIKLIACDASDINSWWDKQLFDRILLDAPCSGTGVIRRHPDIKLLRWEEDILGFQTQQLNLLNHLWEVLKPNGKLLYTTCSVLPEENECVIKQFIHTHSDAKVEKIELKIGHQEKHGWQCFPKINGHDGFYYCLLSKK